MKLDRHLPAHHCPHCNGWLYEDQDGDPRCLQCDRTPVPPSSLRWVRQDLLDGHPAKRGSRKEQEPIA